MNRLILLGNGFDLAHKMKTSYYDFIWHYLHKCFIEATKSFKYEDAMLHIEWISNVGMPSIENMSSVKELMNFEVNDQGIYINVSGGRTVPKSFILKIKNNFFRRLLKDCIKYNWVNIENEYYIDLKRILSNSLTDIQKQKLIESLNNTMAFLIHEINFYFGNLECIKLLPEYASILEQKFYLEDFINVEIDMIRGRNPSGTMILSFNYTNTVEQYIKSIKGDFSVNYIHGLVNNDNNPIIFGFGDEMDDAYKLIESEKGKGFLRYIKSFGYFKTSNYRNLIRFIESNKFQVFVLGHSCGLSDRTMLNMIFEHENCNSIKIFYHENEIHYRELTEEISRHFRDKASMRRKIVPFEKSSKMPQAVD